MFQCYKFIFILFVFILSCDTKILKEDKQVLSLKNDKKNKTNPLNLDPMKGKIVYYSHCVSCHNNDPQKQGSIGPQIYGSSKELLHKKMNFGEYPKSYTPKRSTKIMPLMPHLDKEITNLHAFLNSPS